MMTHFIMMFAGKCLEKSGFITPSLLQKFIHDREEVGKFLPIEDINLALDNLVTAGFIEIVDTRDDTVAYIRYVPRSN